MKFIFKTPVEQFPPKMLCYEKLRQTFDSLTSIYAYLLYTAQQPLQNKLLIGKVNSEKMAIIQMDLK